MSIKIKIPTEGNIYHFFLSLSDKVLYDFNPYPDANSKIGAKMLSQTLLKDKSQKIFGIFDGKKMAGFGFLKASPKETMKEVCQFGVVINEQYQGLGYGRTLSKGMVESAKKNHIKKIWLTVFSDNNRAINLYKSLGFGIEGIFMRNENFGKIRRHVISMALFFDGDPEKERKELWDKVSKALPNYL